MARQNGPSGELTMDDLLEWWKGEVDWDEERSLQTVLPPEMQERNLFWKELAETKEKMRKVLEEFMEELQTKIEQRINSVDDQHLLQEIL